MSTRTSDDGFPAGNPDLAAPTSPVSPAPPIGRRVAGLLELTGPLFAFMTQSAWAERFGDPDIADFVVGNPHELPLPGISEALQRWSVPQNKDWFAYKMSEPEAREVVAASLRERHGVVFEPEDIHLTNGAFAALSVSLRALVDAGDEVIFISPPWFFYEALIQAADAVPVRVKVRLDDFDLDLDAIAAAISERTRAIIVNSPNNPTGRIYPPATLERLGRLLGDASQRQGRPIYLLSDEAYSRIIFDDRPFHSPTTFYDHALLLYTYGKTLLTPGERLGYIALRASMPEEHRGALRGAIMMAQLATGWAFPNALLQHALSDLDQLSIDIAHLQRKRDRMVDALRGLGYEVAVPEGTFYLLPRSPLADDLAYTELLADHDVFVLPGTMAELPGYFRISLTANDEMIERSLPGFAAAIEHANASATAQAMAT